MNDTDLIYATLTGWPPRQPSPTIAPNNPAIEDSDHAATITYTASRVSGVRPISFGTFEHANPGWRRRFKTTGKDVVVFLENLDLIPSQYFNGSLAVYVDGALHREVSLSLAAGAKYIRLGFPTTVERTIDLAMPYCASIAHTGLSVAEGISAPATRLTLPRCLVMGDSRNHGFSCTGIAKTWAQLLCIAKGWQHINLAYGSSTLEASWGTVAGNLLPDVVLCMTDYNFRTLQTPLATFKQIYKDAINNLRAIRPTIKFYVIQSTWIDPTIDVLTLKMVDYRQAEADMLTELGDANNILINGLDLTTVDNATRFPDGVHENDLGASEMATALAALVSL